MKYMAKRNIGFLRHDSLNWKIINLFKKNRDNNYTIPVERFLSILSNYAIPSEVAPQQSFSPLYVTVDSNLSHYNDRTKVFTKNVKLNFKLFN
jgi:hypothetical protein